MQVQAYIWVFFLDVSPGPDFGLLIAGPDFGLLIADPAVPRGMRGATIPESFLFCVVEPVTVNAGSDRCQRL